jgi:ribosomal protein L31E
MPERIITLNLRKYLVHQPRGKRRNKAVKYIRERVSHYTKVKQENVKISQQLNSLVITKYSRTMNPLKLNVKIGTDTADVFPFSEQVAKKPEADQKTKDKKLAKEDGKKSKDQKQAAAPQQKK